MKLEARRQFFHVLFGSAIIAATALFDTAYSLYLTALAFLIGLCVSYAIKKGVKVPMAWHAVQRMQRQHETGLPGKGALFFFIGAIVALALFFNSQQVAVGALCVAVYGDAASTAFGLRFGRHKIAGKKTLEGTLAGIAAAFLFLSFLFQWQAALAAAAVGMLAELLPLDDSFTIPIATGIALSVFALI